MLDNCKVIAERVSRRQLLGAGGAVVAGALASGVPGSVWGKVQIPATVAILNVALGLEHQAIAAYDAGAKSKLLNADQLRLALSFQKDHKGHRDVLIRYIRRFGGAPVEPKNTYDFGPIGAATDIVNLAMRLEQGAEEAYLANAGKLENAEVLNAAVPILEDEVRHTTVLKQLLGLDVTARLQY